MLSDVACDGSTVPATTDAPNGAGRPSARVRALAWVLIPAALLRLALWLGYGNAPPKIWDERDYNAIAVNLARHGEFALRPGSPTSIRPPLYPMAVAGVYQAFGVENFAAVRLLQVGVSLLTIVLAYCLASMLYDRRAGLWAAGLYAVYPSMLGYDGLLLTEVVFTAFLCATCVALVGAYKADSLARLAAAGALLGLAALTRSVMYLFPALLVPFLLLTWRGGARRRVLAVLAVLTPFLAVLTPWTIRNTRLQRTLTVVDCMGGRNFMMGNYEYTPLNRAWNAIEIGGERSWDRVLAAANPGYDALTQGQKDKLALRAAITYVTQHPVQTLRRDAVKFVNFWGLERELVAGASRGFFGRFSASGIVVLTLIIFGAYVATTSLGVFGAVVRPPSDYRLHAIPLMVIAFICGLHTLSFGHSRYHLPLIPLIAAYAAGALSAPGVIWSRRGRPAFAAACVVVGLLGACWAGEILLVDLGRFLDALRNSA
jgi:4-amino-4-deoxy-L-arabinose transferase-like glycosyltransferase